MQEVYERGPSKLKNGYFHDTAEREGFAFVATTDSKRKCPQHLEGSAVGHCCRIQCAIGVFVRVIDGASEAATTAVEDSMTDGYPG